MPARAISEAPRAPARKELYDIGEIPPLGHVPARMYAWAIRKERHGPPETSMRLEVLPTWPIGEDEVLIYVMAGGGKYKGVWGGPGGPGSPLDARQREFSFSRARSPRAVCGPGALDHHAAGG